MVPERGEHDVNKAEQGNENQNHGENLTGAPVVLSGQDLCTSFSMEKKARHQKQNFWDHALKKDLLCSV